MEIPKKVGLLEPNVPYSLIRISLAEWRPGQYTLTIERTDKAPICAHMSRARMFVLNFAVPQMYIIVARHKTIDSLCALAEDAQQDADSHVFLRKTKEKTQNTQCFCERL